MTGATAVRSAEQQPEDVHSNPTDSSEEQPFDMHPRSQRQQQQRQNLLQQRQQQQEQQRMEQLQRMRIPSPSAEELEDGELPSLTKKKKQRMMMGGRIVNGQRTTTRPLNPPNPAGLKKAPPREQRQFWGQMDDDDDDDDDDSDDNVDNEEEEDDDEEVYHDARSIPVSYTDDMPDDELMESSNRRRGGGGGGRSGSTDRHRHNHHNQNRRSRQHRHHAHQATIEREREIDNVSRQDDEYDDASSLGNTYLTQETEDDALVDDFCGQTLTALGDICGAGPPVSKTRTTATSADKFRSSKHRKLHLPDNVDEQEEHTAIEVEFVEPTHNMTPQRKNAYLTAMARKAKVDYRKKKHTTTATTDDTPMDEESNHNNNNNNNNNNNRHSTTLAPALQQPQPQPHRPDGGASGNENDDLYNSFSASEKRKFLKLINTGVSPSQATQDILVERQHQAAAAAAKTRNSSSSTPDEPELVKPPGPEDEDGEDAHHNKPISSPRTPRLAFWKNNNNNHYKGAKSSKDKDGVGLVGSTEVLDSTLPESEDSDEDKFAKSGINYYDGVRRDLDDESFEVPEQVKTPARPPPKSSTSSSHRVKSPTMIGFAALRDRRAKSAPRPRREDKPVAPVVQEKSRSTRELESLVAGTLATRAANAATVPLMHGVDGVDTFDTDDDDTRNLHHLHHHDEDDDSRKSPDTELSRESPDPQGVAPSEIEPAAIRLTPTAADKATAAALVDADATPQAGSARLTRKVEDLIAAAALKQEEEEEEQGKTSPPTAALQQIEDEIMAAPRAPLPQVAGPNGKHHKQKIRVEGPMDVSMDAYLNAANAYSAAKMMPTTSMNGLASSNSNSLNNNNNDNVSVYTTGTGITGVTAGSSYTQSSRVRRPGAAKSRLAKAREAEGSSHIKGKGWHESIRAAAASTNQVWEPEAGWVTYEEPKLEMPKSDITEKIHIDLSRSKSHKTNSSSFEQQQQQQPAGEYKAVAATPVPFPRQWEKDRTDMIHQSTTSAATAQPSRQSDGRHEEEKLERSLANQGRESNGHYEEKQLGRSTANQNRALESHYEEKELGPSSANNGLESHGHYEEQKPGRSSSVNKGREPLGHYEEKLRHTAMNEGRESYGHYEEKKFEPLAVHGTPLEVADSQEPSKPAGWLESMKAATAELAKEGKTHGQTWDPEHGWTGDGHDEDKVSDYVDLDAPEPSKSDGWTESMKAATAQLAKEGRTRGQTWDPEHGWTRAGDDRATVSESVDHDSAEPSKPAGWTESMKAASAELANEGKTHGQTWDPEHGFTRAGDDDDDKEVVSNSVQLDTPEPSKPAGWLESMKAATAELAKEGKMNGQTWDPEHGWRRVGDDGAPVSESVDVDTPEPSKPTGWLESMKAATAGLAKEGKTQGQTWHPEHGWTGAGDDKVSDYVDLDTPTASGEVTGSSEVAERSRVAESSEAAESLVSEYVKAAARANDESDAAAEAPGSSQAVEEAQSLPRSPADDQKEVLAPHYPVIPPPSHRSSDKKLNQWIAKAEQEPRKPSERSTESSARAVASAGTADAYVQLGDNGSIHPHSRTVLKVSPQSKAPGKATIASSYISTEDDDTEVDSAPLLSASGAFPSHDDRPVSPVVDIVKEKVGAEERGLFPEQGRKPKRVNSAAVARSPAEEIGHQVSYESSSVHTSPSRRRGAGPIDTDEVDETWDSDDEERSSVNWQSETSWTAESRSAGPRPDSTSDQKTHSESRSKSAGKTRYSQKSIPKLQGSRKDTSPVSRRTPSKPSPLPNGHVVTPLTDGRTPENLADSVLDRQAAEAELENSPRAGGFHGAIECPPSPTVKSMREHWEDKTGQNILDDLNTTADTLQEQAKQGKSAPGQAEWKSFLGKKVQAESAAAARSQQGKNERRNGNRDRSSRRESNESDEDSLFEFEKRAVRSSVGGESGTFKSDLSPIRPGEDYEQAASEAYGPGENDRGNFFKRMTECAAPVMPSRVPCANTEIVEDKEEEYVKTSKSAERRSKSTPRRPRSQSNEVLSPGSVVSVEDFGAKTAYLEAIAMKAAVSKPRSSSRKRSSAASVVSSSSSVHSEKWQAFLERKKASGGPISSRVSNVSEVSKAAEKYASEKVEELMSNMSRSQSAQRGTRDSQTSNARQRAESVKAAEDLAAARVEAMMAALSSSQLDEGEI